MTALVFFWMLSYIVQVLYKENIGKGIPIPITPEMERVKHNQENFSSVFKKQTKNPLTNLKSFFKKINGCILKPNQLIPVKTLTCLVYNLMLPFPVKSVSPFWLNINIT